MQPSTIEVGDPAVERLAARIRRSALLLGLMIAIVAELGRSVALG